MEEISDVQNIEIAGEIALILEVNALV